MVRGNRHLTAIVTIDSSATTRNRKRVLMASDIDHGVFQLLEFKQPANS